MELCGNFTKDSCRNCPCKDGTDCMKMKREAAALIKRQYAEIYKLKRTPQVVVQIHTHIDEQFQKECEYEIKTSRAEAIKEFAIIIENRLRELQQYICKLPHERTNHGYLVDDVLATIYSATKEILLESEETDEKKI